MKIVALCFAISVGLGSAIAQQAPPLLLQQTISLPGITGKFDHLAIDIEGKRLFVAATGNHSVQVIDLAAGKVDQSISGLGKPHGLVWVASTHTLYVADGTLAELRQYRGLPLALAGSIKLSEDADDMVYNDSNHLLFVGHGGSEAAPARIAVIDTSDFHLKADLAVASHPEALEIDSKSQRVFANIADDNEIAVLAADGDAVIQKWKLNGAGHNVPSAFDAARRVLYVACRTPAVLLALDSDTGKELARIPTGEGADDLFYDSSTHRSYVIAGSGEVDIIQSDGRSALRSMGVISTVPGARTALFVPSQSILYVAAPVVGSKPAEIRVYSAAPPRGGN